MPDRAGIASAIVGAATWTVLVIGRLGSVAEGWWIARDDAVITLSHAKNLVRHGSIGVSPGGDRVEGFSSPLHFAVAALVQLPGDVGYTTLTIVILVGAVAATGGLVAVGLAGYARAQGRGPAASAAVAITVSAAIAATTCVSWTSVGWLGSGMENPLIVLCGAGIVAGALTESAPRVGTAVLVASLCLLSVSRVELAALIVPVVVASGALVAERHPGSWRPPVFTMALPLLFAGAIHVGRRLYFGEWLPNTAVVQDRSSGIDELVTIGLIAAAFVAALSSSLVARLPLRDEERRAAQFACRTVGLLASTAVVWMWASGRTSGSLRSLLLLPPLLPLGALVGVLVLIRWMGGRKLEPVHHLLAGLAIVPLSQYVVTGPARLEEFRIAGLAVPFLALWAGIMATDTLWPLLVSHRAARRPTLATWVPVGVVALVAVAGLAWTWRNDGARPLNYEIPWADDLVVQSEALRRSELSGEGLTILANADLGKVSYAKTSVMVDLGLLGDPLLTAIEDDHPHLVDDYLRRVAVPDLVNMQGGLSCAYADWLEHDDFARRYELITGESRERAPGCASGGMFATWRRADGRAEYALTRSVLASDRPDVIVRDAVDRCVARDGGPFRCQQVRRAVQRASVRLRSAGTLSEVVTAMQRSPSFALDEQLLRRRPGWAVAAHDAFVDLVRSDGDAVDGSVD